MSKKSAALPLILAAFLGAPSVAVAQGHEEHHQQAQQTAQDPAEAQDMMGVMGRCREVLGQMMDHGQMMDRGMSGMGDPGMRSMMGPGMMGMGPAALLGRKDELGLDASQVRRLEEIQQQWSDAHEAHKAEMREVMTRLSEATSDGELDIDRYESLLEEWAKSYVQDHVRMARLGQSALQVLTEAQREQARTGMRRMMKMQDKAWSDSMAPGAQH